MAAMTSLLSIMPLPLASYLTTRGASALATSDGAPGPMLEMMLLDVVLSCSGGPGSPSVRSPHFPPQKLAAVHPEGRCDWLSCQVGRSGPKSYPTQTVRTSCWPVACGQLPRGLSCKVRNRSSHCGRCPVWCLETLQAPLHGRRFRH